MFDPLTYWARALDGLQTIATTQRKVVQTGAASEAVIAARSQTIGDAIRSPWTADYAELSRMVPEKTAAFGRSGSAMMSGLLRMQSDYLDQLRYAGGLMARGRPLTPDEWVGWSSRSAAYAMRTFEASSRLGRDALAPIHKTATANARRLGTGR
ncbi:MAG: hypothetical protein ABIS14_16130 [Sphingomonas sp.]